MMDIVLGVCWGILIGIVVGLSIPRRKQLVKHSAIDTLDLTKNQEVIKRHSQVLAEAVAETPDLLAGEYTVTGAPRHIPWSRRKKELEQAARQKRRQLESFREEA